MGRNISLKNRHGVKVGGKNKKKHRTRRHTDDNPSRTLLLTFTTTTEQLAQKTANIIRNPKLVASDCFISCLEILGFIDRLSADIMRIIGRDGVKDVNIELTMIYLLYTRVRQVYNCKITWYGEFEFGRPTTILQQILDGMINGESTILGVETIPKIVGHIFIVNKVDDVLYYFDPQETPTHGTLDSICNFSNNTYKNYIDKGTGYVRWSIIMRSELELDGLQATKLFETYHLTHV
jgi:hypothetical protein